MVVAATSPATVSARAATLGSSAIRDILEQARRPGVISLAGGIPDPALFPVAAVERAVHDAFGRFGPMALQYGPTCGEPWFREWAAEATNAPTAPERVVVTAGSQQAVDLLSWVLVDPGQTVVVGDPDYLGTLQALARHGARLHTVPITTDGLDTEVLANELRNGLRPVLCTMVPNFHNPSGVTWSSERRRHLAALADHYGFWIVEDDPYGRLSYDAAPPPPVTTETDRVIRVRSVSKVLAPGLRVGWLSAPATVVRAVERAKQAADLHTATLSQAIVACLVLPDGHHEQLVATYRQRRDALLQAAATHLPTAATNRPAGGMFCWVDLGEGYDTTALLPTALEAGVAYVPGAAFSTTHRWDGAVRLSFATASADQLDTGVQRIASVLAAARRARVGPDT